MIDLQTPRFTRLAGPINKFVFIEGAGFAD
jgi:hypothetical protein